MRYGNLVKPSMNNNENDEANTNESPYLNPEQNETLKELSMLNNNKEGVLQRISDMKNKMQLLKK